MQVNARVLTGASQGRNLIRELEEGLSLTITRVLLDPTVTVPRLPHRSAMRSRVCLRQRV
jgi:hypothetical protein